MRAAPAYQKIHHVHHGILVRLPTGLAQLLACGLKPFKDLGPVLTFGKKAQGQGSKLAYRLRQAQSLFEGLMKLHRKHSLGQAGEGGSQSADNRSPQEP
ncbi:MAG TPA: hypothetical protein VG013_03320 [Gemmataceae bacterium]|jgi:hypothetical protein|nr:hypothetical protein [Gemmataceae bacterium]